MSLFPKAVFFDCWSTVLTFEEKRKDWNTAPLKRHVRESSSVDWASIDEFVDGFFKRYYQSHLDYEISARSFLTLLLRRYHLTLDCSLEMAENEILDGLNPQPVKGIEAFLKTLEKKGIPYYILSNTIYPEEDSFRRVKEKLPDSRFEAFFGSSAIGVKKPNPDFFQTALSYFEQPIGESVYIGDAYYQDVYGSFCSGFALSVWLNWKGKKKDESFVPKNEREAVRYREVRSYDELTEALEKGLLLPLR